MHINPDLGYSETGCRMQSAECQKHLQKDFDLYNQVLRDIRVRKDITQQQLANRLRRPQSFISKYESGERRLDVIEFIHVCHALDEEPSEVLKNIEKRETHGI